MSHVHVVGGTGSIGRLAALAAADCPTRSCVAETLVRALRTPAYKTAPRYRSTTKPTASAMTYAAAPSPDEPTTPTD